MPPIYERGRAIKRTRRRTPARSGVAPNFPTYVPARPGATRPPARRQPTAAEIRRALAQERGYASQGRAVRRVAATQRALGPGVAVRPPRGQQILKPRHIERVKREREAATQRAHTRVAERAFRSLAESIDTQATLQRAVRTGQERTTTTPQTARRVLGIRISKPRMELSRPRGSGSYFSAIGRTPAQLATQAAILNIPDKRKRERAIMGFSMNESARRHDVALANAPAAKALDLLSRVNYAQAGATSELLKGHGAGKAVQAAGRGFTGKERKTFGTVLREQGVKGPLASIAGFGLDVLADPTTYVSFGATSVARHAAASAARDAAKVAQKAALRSALAQGMEGAEAKTYARERARQAAGAAARQTLRKYERSAPQRHLARGIEVRFGGRRIPGVTRATAGLRHGARVATAPVTDRGGAKATREFARTLGSQANANVREFGQSIEEQYAVKGLQREARAQAERTTRHATSRANALLGRLTADERRKVIDAIESGNVGALRGQATRIKARKTPNLREYAARLVDARDPDRLHNVARRTQDDLKYLQRVGQRSGLLGTGIGKQARKRLVSVNAATPAGIRSSAKVRQALVQARKDMQAARVTLRNAKPGSDRVQAKRTLRHAEERVEGLRQRYNAIGHQKASTFARQQGTAPTLERMKGEAQGYFPRIRQSEVKEGGVLSRFTGGLDRDMVPHVVEQVGGNRPVVGAAQRRTHRDTRAQQDLTPEGRVRNLVLTDDVRKTLAQYGGSVGRASAARDLNTKLLQQFGQRLPRNISKQQLAELEASGRGVYRVRRGVLERVDPESHELLRSVSQGRAHRSGGQYAILSDDVVRRVRNRQPDIGSKSAPLRAFDAAQSGFKGLALSTPAYLIRNLSGDLWNAWGDENFFRLARNFVKGQKALNDLGRYERALRRFGKELPEGKRTVKLTEDQAAQFAKHTGAPVSREVPAMAVALLAEKMGVIRQGRFLELMGEGGKLSRPRTTHGWQDAVKRVEDSTRMATFLGGLQRGMNPREAAQRATQIHFDYGDLTSFEKGVLRRAMPFYTFTARNLPLQGKRLLTRPGKYATLAHAVEEGRQETGLPLDFRKGQNPFEARQLGIPVQWHGKTYTVSMGSPFVDLNDVVGVATSGPIGAADTAIARTGEMLSPLLKTAPELKYNLSLFYRDQIQPSEEPYTRAPQWAVALAKNQPWFRKATGMVDDYAPTEGQPTWGWPRKVDYTARALAPGAIGAIASSGALGLGVQGKNARSMNVTQQILGNLGLRTVEYNADQAKMTRLYDERERIATQIEKLRRRTAPGTNERISREHPTPEFNRLYEQQSQIETDLDVLERKTRPGGIVKGRRQGAAKAIGTLSRGGGTLSRGGGTLSRGGGTLRRGGSILTR
jgi:hypothetical protein